MKRHIHLFCLFFGIGLCAGQAAAADAAEQVVPPAAKPIGIGAYPLYPYAAVERGLEGTVVLSVLASEQGEVMEVKVAQSSGHSKLDEAAVRSAWKAKFRALGMLTQYKMPVQFTIDGKK